MNSFKIANCSESLLSAKLTTDYITTVIFDYITTVLFDYITTVLFDYITTVFFVAVAFPGGTV